MLKKIFPAGVGNAPYNSFKLILLAEGYVAGEDAKFAGDCVDLIEALLDITPFNLTRAHPHWLSVYSSFAASQNSGPAIDQVAQAGRTRFDSSLTTATQLLTLSQAKLNAYVNGESFSVDGAAIPMSRMAAKNARTYGRAGILICVLVPSLSGGDGENVPGANDFHFVATTKSGRYEQVVARAIASCVGLGDEYELPGPAFLAPDLTTTIPPLNYNLQYFAAGPPNPLDPRTKWLHLFPLSERAAPSINAKADPNVVDATLVTPPVGRDVPAFWEGGGGYRTKVWRASRDCLMRRRIGDFTRPVRGERVPFCAPCREALSGVIR